MIGLRSLCATRAGSHEHRSSPLFVSPSGAAFEQSVVLSAMRKSLACDGVVANDCEDLKCLVGRNVFAICSASLDCDQLLPKGLVVNCPANAFGSPSGAIETLVSRPCSLTFGESMLRLDRPVTRLMQFTMSSAFFEIKWFTML